METAQQNQTKKKTLADFTLSKFDQMAKNVPDEFKQEFKQHFDKKSRFLIPVLLFFFISKIRSGGEPLIKETEVLFNHGTQKVKTLFYTIERVPLAVALMLDSKELTFEVYGNFHPNILDGPLHINSFRGRYLMSITSYENGQMTCEPIGYQRFFMNTEVDKRRYVFLSEMNYLAQQLISSEDYEVKRPNDDSGPSVMYDTKEKSQELKTQS